MPCIVTSILSYAVGIVVTLLIVRFVRRFDRRPLQ
jgi:hypothetical protein